MFVIDNKNKLNYINLPMMLEREKFDLMIWIEKN